VHSSQAKQVLPGHGQGRWLGVLQLVLGLCWLLTGFAGTPRFDVVSVAMALLASSVGAFALFTARPSLDVRGLRPSGWLRRLPWQHISSAYTTTSPSRRGYVALVVQGHAKPVWIKDPDQVTLKRWTAETGRPGTSYGYDGSTDAPPR